MPSLSTINDFFNFPKMCYFCKKGSKAFKVSLSCYSSSSSQCILTEEEKKKFYFKCPICGFVNQLDFTQMCNEYTVKLLQNKTLLVTANILKEIGKKWLILCVEEIEIEQAFIKLKLQEYDLFLIIIYTNSL